MFTKFSEKAVDDLEAAHIAVPPALYLAILSLRHTAGDDRRKS
jgi:hypothetical protein